MSAGCVLTVKAGHLRWRRNFHGYAIGEMRALAVSGLLILLICMSVQLSGCTWLLNSDFRKGTKIAAIDVGRVYTVAASIDLPIGEADLAFVARDYDCGEPLGASIDLTIQFANGTVLKRDVNLAEITWPMSGQGCRPIGYVRLDDSAYTRPLQITVGQDSNPVKFSIDVSKAADAARQVNIWVVYGDRNPVDRMLGTRDGN